MGMSKTIQVRLNDKAEEALALLCSSGLAESDAINAAVVLAADRVDKHHLISDPVALERALDKSHDVIAEISTTQRPPR